MSERESLMHPKLPLPIRAARWLRLLPPDGLQRPVPLWIPIATAGLILVIVIGQLIPWPYLKLDMAPILGAFILSIILIKDIAIRARWRQSRR